MPDPRPEHQRSMVTTVTLDVVTRPYIPVDEAVTVICRGVIEMLHFTQITKVVIRNLEFHNAQE